MNPYVAMLLNHVLAYGNDNGDTTWTGFSGLVLGILIGLVCLVWLFKGLKK